MSVFAVAGVPVDWLSRRGVTGHNSSRTDTLFTPHAADEELAGEPAEKRWRTLVVGTGRGSGSLGAVVVRGIGAMVTNNGEDLSCSMRCG